MKLTNQIVARIARETKQVCHPKGFGCVVCVFEDGTTMQGISQNDVVARGAPNGEWEYRVACFQFPMTRAQVREQLEEIR